MRRVLLVMLSSVFALCAVRVAESQDGAARAACERDFSPQSGQSGKDVIWVPTADEVVKAMLEAAKVTASDVVYDLGAGDGKIAITAARDFGARAVGIEYNPKMVKLGQCLARAAGVANQARIIEGDIFETDFSDATVVTLYLLPHLNERLRPKLLQLKPGTRVVSNSFKMGDWVPDERILVDGHERAYLWVIPQQVAGTWLLRGADGDPLRLKLNQSFQHIEGVAMIGDKRSKLRDTKLRGNRVRFTYDGRTGPVAVQGVVQDDQMRVAITANGKTVNYSGERA